MLPFLRRWLRRLPILGAGAMLAWSLAAQGVDRMPELGNPFIRNYAPKETGGDSQNWSVAQDGRGVIYIANNQGALEYDGARWRLIRTRNRTVVRSLAVDDQGRIFVGAVGEFGYLAPDAVGQMRFVPLTGLVEAEHRAITDVWTTVATRRGILFQSREGLFLYDGTRIRTWRAATTFHVAFQVQGRIFVRQRGIGLMELGEKDLALVPGGERFANESVFAMLPLPGPGDPILVGSRKQGLWRLAGGALTPFPSQAEAFLKENALYSGAALADGTLALATITGGVVFIGSDGTLRGILDRASGLQGDNVKFLYPDRQSSLWLALDNGISKVEWPSPLSVLDERMGLKGTVWAMQRHLGILYAATGQGAYRLDTTPDPHAPPSASRPRFREIEGVKTQSLAFLPTEDGLLVANSQGVFLVQGDKGRLIRPSSSVAISFHRSRKDPDRIFVGFQGGLISLHRRPGGGGWTDEGIIPGVSDDIYAITEDGQGRLWLGLGAQGVLRVSFPEGWKGGAAPAPVVARFGPEQGLPASSQIYAVAVGGGLLFTTHQGIFTFDEASGRFGEDPRFVHLFPDGPRWVKGLVADAQGRLWMDSIDEQRGIHETGFAVPGPDGPYRWDPIAFRRFGESAIESIYPDPDGRIWFGGPGGIIRYDPILSRPREQAFPALLRRVTCRGGRLLFGGAEPPGPGTGSAPSIPYAENAPRFEFSSPSFDQEAANEYQVWLEGYDKDWSPWTAEAQKEYTNLHEGKYRFRVRARNIYGQIGGEAVYPFRVLAPWYRTWWAYLLYFGLGSVILALGLQARTRLLRQRNIFLHARIAEATMELQEREHQLERMNVDLQELNAQKNEYLGIVAHDLRNPLQGILLNAEMIEQSGTPDETKSLARQVALSAEDMSHLVARFLDIAAIDSGGIKPNPEPIDLRTLAHELVEVDALRAAAKDIRLLAEIPDAVGGLEADRRFLRSVLQNLLSNAIKFSPPGKEVVLRVEEGEGHVIISVIDQGPGLSEEDKGRLFQRFAKLSARPTGGEGSIGLGLSIIKHMVDAMGGRIWVDSEPGKGAAFRVELPRRACAPVEGPGA